jgi:hypothetical protein
MHSSNKCFFRSHLSYAPLTQPLPLTNAPRPQVWCEHMSYILGFTVAITMVLYGMAYSMQ